MVLGDRPEMLFQKKQQVSTELPMPKSAENDFFFPHFNTYILKNFNIYQILVFLSQKHKVNLCQKWWHDWLAIIGTRYLIG